LPPVPGIRSNGNGHKQQQQQQKYLTEWHKNLTDGRYE
jgi:hypothetical protein